MSIAEFLLARIAEDEAAASPASGRVDWRNGGPFNPARVLAECEAKRLIVELHTSSHNDPYYAPQGRSLDTCDVCVNFHADMDCSNEPWPCPTLRILARPYADHPDYPREVTP